MSRIASFAVLICIIILLGAMFFKVMASFWLPLFLAALLVVIFKPLHRWMVVQCRGRERRAAIFTTLAILFIVLAPIAWAGTLAIMETETLLSKQWGDVLSDRAEALRTKYELKPPYPELLEIQSLFDKLNQSSPPEADEVETPSIVDHRDVSDSVKRARQRVGALKERVDADYAIAAENKKPRTSAKEVDESFAELQAGLEEFGTYVGTEPKLAKLQYDQRLGSAVISFRKLRRQLASGPIRAALIELANPSEQRIREWQSRAFGYLQKWLLSLTGQTTAFLGNMVIGLFVMIISLYYFLIDGPSLVKAGMRLSPLDDKHEEELLAEFDMVSRAVVLATLLSAIVQGLLAAVGYVAVGASPLFLLTILTILLAMVPFVGAAAVWVPVCLWLAFMQGRMGAAIGLAIYGAAVVSMADNLIKPWVLQGQSKLHPLLALLSVLGGVKAMGPIGILVGPMTVSFLQALLNMLNVELLRMDKQGAPPKRIKDTVRELK